MSDIEDDIEANMMEMNGTVSYDDESIIWEGRPSQWINFGSFIFWTLVWCIPVMLYYYWNYQGLSDLYYQYEVYYENGLIILAILPPTMLLWHWLNVYYQHTIVTKNKVIERKGITSIFSNEENCEISDIDDIKAPPAGLLALVGCASLVLITKDMDQPVIWIRAIKDRDDLKNKLTPIWRKLRIERKGFFSNM